MVQVMEEERLRLAEEARVREEAEAAARAEEAKEQQRQAKLRERAANIARLKPQAPAKVLPLSESPNRIDRSCLSLQSPSSHRHHHDPSSISCHILSHN